MRKSFATCVVLLVITCTLSCNKNGRSTPKRTIIDGKIANFQTMPKNNKFMLEVGDFGGSTTTYTTTVKADGTFKIYFDQYMAQDVKIMPLIRNFIAHPGDSIHIDLDYKAIGDVKFSGDAEKTNTDLYHYTSENYTIYDNEQEKLFFMAMDTSNYKAFCQNMQVDLLKKRDEFIEKYQPNDEVKSWTKNYINIHYYSKLLMFNGFYNSVQSRKNPAYVPAQLKGFVVDDKDLDEIYNSDLLNAESYNLLPYLMSHGHNPIKIVKRDYDGFIKLGVTGIEKSNRSPLIKQLLIGWLFYYQLQKNNADDFEKNQKLFDDKIQAAFIKQPLKDYYEAVKKNAENPKAKSDTLLNNATATAKKLMDSVKSKYKGKVVFVNFWATWCGPCIGEIPSEKKLQEKYKGQDVVFLNICLNSSKDAWQNDVKKYKLTGEQLYFDSKQSGQIMLGLGITGIPHHVLMNRNGDLTESGFFIHPGDPLTERKINALLDQPVTKPETNNDGFKSIKVKSIQ